MQDRSLLFCRLMFCRLISVSELHDGPQGIFFGYPSQATLTVLVTVLATATTPSALLSDVKHCNVPVQIYMSPATHSPTSTATSSRRFLSNIASRNPVHTPIAIGITSSAEATTDSLESEFRTNKPRVVAVFCTANMSCKFARKESMLTLVNPSLQHKSLYTDLDIECMAYLPTTTSEVVLRHAG
eukprot:m.334124 g.334124  ORF g.334124 m.334124 type:complete len:185 (+) comp20505_c0_seq33:2391-2945(+)